MAHDDDGANAALPDGSGLTVPVLPEAALERLFIGARAAAPVPSDRLVALVMNDAMAQMRAPGLFSPGPGEARARAVAARGIAAPLQQALQQAWRGLSAGFGGGGVVASLGAVAVIALFLGYAGPEAIGADLLPPGEAEAALDGGVEIEPVAIYFLAGG